MKKQFTVMAAVLFGLVMSMCLTSCNNNNPEDLIVGIWKCSTDKVDNSWSDYTFTFDAKKNVEFLDQYYQEGGLWDTRKKTGTYALDKDANTGSVHYTQASIWGRGPAQSGPIDETERFQYEIKGDTLVMTYGLDWERPSTRCYIKEQ